MIRLYYHADMLNHDTGPAHPEKKERLLPLIEQIRNTHNPSVEILDSCDSMDPTGLFRVHVPDYVSALQAAVNRGEPYFHCLDCPISGGTYEASLKASSLCVAAVKSVLEGSSRRAFCLVRPPGHHALPNRAMGFCYFNNVALAATTALDHENGFKVAIIDWDAHHGNGTQDTFIENPDVLYISLHGDPLITYPGTGYREESGTGRGEGFTLNFPLKARISDDEYRSVFHDQAIPALEAFHPDLILISNGYDGHREDPLVPNLQLHDDVYHDLIRTVTTVSDDLCDGRLVVILEGGYNPEVIRRLGSDVLEVLSGSG